jgi:hypothetical protein
MFLSCYLPDVWIKTVLHLRKAIFELIATEGTYVRDLQLVVEVREHFLYLIDNLMVPFLCL